MILLSFTSVLKYAIGLVLVMLGLIPYEAIETQSENRSIPTVDTVFIDRKKNTSEQVMGRFKYHYDVSTASLPEIRSESNFISKDSIRLFVINSESALVACKDCPLVIKDFMRQE